MNVMTIKAQISEVDIVRISAGQKARLTIFSEPDTHYNATLRANSFRVRVLICFPFYLIGY